MRTCAAINAYLRRLSRLYRNHGRRAVVGVLGLLVGAGFLGAAVWYRAEAPKAPPKETTIRSATLYRYVSFDATVAADTDITVAARTAGTIMRLPVREGDVVKKGALLAVLDDRTAAAAVSEAQARYRQARAALEKLLAGARVEEVRSARATWQSATESLQDAERDFALAQETLRAALASAESAVDAYFVDARTAHPRLTFSLPVQYALPIENARAELTATLSRQTATTDTADVLSRSQAWRTFLHTFITTLADVMRHNATLAESLAPAQDRLIATQQSVLAAERTLAQAASAVHRAREGETLARLAYEQLTAHARAEDIAAAEAAVSLAEAALARAQAAYADTRIRAPQDGVIARLFKDAGEYVAPAEPVARLLAREVYATVEIPEVDLPLVHRGQAVQVVFDAYPTQEIPATLALIYPDALNRGGIVYYRGKVVFDPDTIAALTILPDMSLKVRVPKEKKEVARALEADFVHTDEEGSYIWIESEDGSYIKQPVRIGFRGDRLVEILDEIPVGTRVIQKR